MNKKKPPSLKKKKEEANCIFSSLQYKKISWKAAHQAKQLYINHINKYFLKKKGLFSLIQESVIKTVLNSILWQ